MADCCVCVLNVISLEEERNDVTYTVTIVVMSCEVVELRRHTAEIKISRVRKMARTISRRGVRGARVSARHKVEHSTR